MTVRDFEFFSKAAKEKYPFLNIRHVYLSSGRQVARVMQEFRAGRVQADVLGNSPEPLLYFKQQGVTGPYRSPENKNLLQDAWDPDGYWSGITTRSEEHTSELQSLRHLVCRLLLEKKN